MRNKIVKYIILFIIVGVIWFIISYMGDKTHQNYENDIINNSNVQNSTSSSLIHELWIKGMSVEELKKLGSSTEISKDTEITTKQAIENELAKNDINYTSDIIRKAIKDTADMIELDLRYALTLVHTESNFNPKIKGYNISSVDYGLCQINSKGEPVYMFVGKTIELANGNIVLINSTNYKTDIYVNLYMGLKSYQMFLEKSQYNPFIAYACYNVGSNVVNIFNGYDMKELTCDEVCTILNNSGVSAYKHASRNIKNNFYPKYQIYFK